MIRVLINRHIRQGCLNDYHELVRAARKIAVGVEGFIAGEIFEEKSDSNHAIIISSWENFAYWESWYKSQEREAISDKMMPLLEKEKITLLKGCQSKL